MVRVSNRNEQLVLDLFAAISAKDLAAVANYLHEQITWKLMLADTPGTGPHHGREAVLTNIVGAAKRVFREGDPKIHPIAIVSAGDFVMAETRGSGHRIDGEPYKNVYAWSFQIRDGKIFETHEYMDSAYARDFLGVNAKAQCAKAPLESE